MKVEVLADAEAVAQRAAQFIAGEIRDALQSRPSFVLGLSGGTTPWRMLRLLSHEDVPWEGVQLVQVDEREGPKGDPDRNSTHIDASLLRHVALPADHVHAMPTEAADLAAAARSYQATLESVAGTPPVLDLVHLGLGADGHTASLVPGDAVLDVDDAEVAVAGPYQGRRRLTLTYAPLRRARRIVWVVTGAAKAQALRRLVAGDNGIPAGRIRHQHALLLADLEAASELS